MVCLLITSIFIRDCYLQYTDFLSLVNMVSVVVSTFMLWGSRERLNESQFA